MFKNYDFLNLVKESEALYKGSQVSEKIHHLIYKKIQSLSEVPFLRAGKVFILNEALPELSSLNTGKHSFIMVLKNLVSDKLIVPLCMFFFEEETGALKLQPFYISLPASEQQNTLLLYSETIQFSVRSIKKYIDNKPPLTRERILSDLELDFQSQIKPASEKFRHVIYDPTILIVPTIFDFHPGTEILSAIKKDLKDELIRQKVLLEVFEYGTLANRPDDSTLLYEVADEFLRNKILPKYRMDTQLKPEIDAIFLEESAYYIDPFVGKTTEFSKKLSDTVKKYLENKFHSIRFPGLLSIELVRTLSEPVYAIYEAQYKQEIYQQIHAYIEKLKSLLSQQGEEGVFYLTQEEIEEINPKIIDYLIHSPEIIYLKWYMKNSSIHIFGYKDKQIFSKILKSLASKEKIPDWKILALKFLIEEYEDEFPDLFKDRKFKELYGKLLRKAYIRYMPWYYKIAVLLNIPWFRDTAFQFAKKNIAKEQKSLEAWNRKLMAERTEQRIQEKKEKLLKAQEISFLVRLFDKILTTISRGEIPYYQQLVKECIGVQEKEIRDFLQKHPFESITLNQKEIILYPKNFHRKIYLAKLYNAVSQFLMKDTRSPNRQELIRMKTYLEYKLKESRTVAAPASDPYQTLSSLIEKEKHNKKDLIEELEV